MRNMCWRLGDWFVDEPAGDVIDWEDFIDELSNLGDLSSESCRCRGFGITGVTIAAALR